MCACSNNCACESSVTLPYLNGAAGENGNAGGYSGKWTYKTTTSAPPVTGTVRFNNSSYSLITTLYIHDVGFGSADYNLFLDNLSNGSNYGRISIYKEFDSTAFWHGEITNVVQSAGYHTVTVTYLADSGNGSFSNNDNLIISFTPKGIDGDPGSDAATKAYVDQSFAQTPYIQHKAFGVGGLFSQILTIGADELTQTGDTYKFEVELFNDNDNNVFSTLDIEFNSVDELTSFNLLPGKTVIRGTIVRTASDPHYVVECFNYDNDGGLFNAKMQEGHSTEISDWTTTNTIQLRLLTNTFSGGCYLKKLQSEIILK